MNRPSPAQCIGIGAALAALILALLLGGAAGLALLHLAAHALTL